MKTNCSRNGFVWLLIIALAYSTSHAATFTVTNASASGPGSLRQAILDANGAPGRDMINFAIEPFDGTVKTIMPTAGNPMPDVLDPVIIDGYTQPGASVNMLADGNNAVLLIAINLTNNSTLRISAGDSTVRGLVLHSFGGAGAGLVLQTRGSNVVEGCFIGTDAAGTSNLGFGNYALSIPSGTGNRIGGTAPASRNLLCGGALGVDLFGGSNVVQGNFIGTDRHGSGRLGRGTAMRINSTAPGNLIGGTVPGARNVISGNMIGGIQINSSNNVVQGNFIGTDVTGTTDLGNGSHGIAISSPTATDNLIGGTAVGAGNVISGSSNSGIDVSSGAIGTGIQGNFIGTDASGMLDLGNNGFGVFLGSGTNAVGGTVPAARNIIAGNGNNGIRITVGGNVVRGNFVGVGATGTNALPNLLGIYIASDQNFIGGTMAGAGNVVSGNSSDGIEVVNASRNTIQGNMIGTDPTGTRAVGNAVDGIVCLGIGGANVIGAVGAPVTT